MTRAVGVVLLAAAWALAVADLVWWSPAILLALLALAGRWARCWFVMALADVLRFVGRDDLARVVLGRALARCRRRARELGQ